ncbi:MAG: cysteine desulfurase [Ignavibacteriales bacterium]|nr:cysteine desulfurase [Ignavibacteriales bacterium]
MRKEQNKSAKILKPRPFNVKKIREDFPILKQTINGKPLVYLDNAATSQKPQFVIDAMNHYYMEENSNIHRGVHYLSELATQSYEAARVKIQKHINAKHLEEVIFTRGTTEAINLVAHSFGRFQVKEGDEIIISAMEHHSNIVPWQLLRDEKGIVLRIIPINDRGELFIDKYEKMLNERTKIVSIVHVSNVLGTINPIKQMIEIAHKNGVPVLIDGAQGVPHMKIDVQDLDCDFYAFSGHKMYGPTGVGVYINQIRFDDAIHHEHNLLNYAQETLSSIKGLRIIGTAAQKSSVLSFVLKNIHPHDIGPILDDDGIALRTGHHCAQPVMKCFEVPATARASFAMYNIKEEVDALVKGIHRVIKVFS